MFTRRKIIQLSAASPVLGSLLNNAARAQGLGTDYDVIVLGAGVAGLAAAERLVNLGSELKVLVLEARNRIGGRVYSVPHQGSSRDAELGALELRQAAGKNWPLIARLGLTVDEFPDASIGFYPGMSALVRALAESSTGRVQLDSEVREVFWREGLVGVKYMNRGLSSAVTGRRLIVALPAGVLRSGALAINPAFPASKVNALQSLTLDAAVSLAMLFPAGSGALKNPGQPWLFQDDTSRLRAFPVNDAGELLLEAQFMGSKAELLSSQPEELQFSLAMRAFAPAFSSQPALSSARWARTVDWQGDKYSRGAGTQAASPLTHLEIAGSMGGTVFFAGEATADPASVGTIHGAYESGERAAREVALSLDLDGEAADDEEPILELLL